jgi:hypothetical protein
MALSLSHNLPDDRTSRPSDNNESLTFSQLRTSLIKVLRNSPESREPICDALELIESLQQQIETKRHPDAGEPLPQRAARRVTQAPASQEYLIQKTDEGEFLTERRPSGSQPFRCPKDAYDAAARILSKATQPLHFEELHEQFNTAMGDRQPDYRLRVCLRFWLHHKIIERSRTRYRATDPATFLTHAGALWTS